MNLEHFEVPSHPSALRQVNMGAVSVLDETLRRLSPGHDVLHAIDPRRLVAFTSGGPPLWSVAQVALGQDTYQFLTYGLSRAVVPSAPFDFELTMRVHAPEGDPIWAILLLRHLARYQMSGGRPIKPGEHWCLGGPISRAAAPLADQHHLPNTRMDTAFVVAGPTLQTPNGPIELRNVIGLDAAERNLREIVRMPRFVAEVYGVNPSLAVSLQSASMTTNPAFVNAIRHASASEGSDTQAHWIPGFQWRDDARGYCVHIPAGFARQLKAILMARLPFKESLLVHQTEVGEGSQVLMVPGEQLSVMEVTPNRLTITVPTNGYETAFWGDEAVEWLLVYPHTTSPQATGPQRPPNVPETATWESDLETFRVVPLVDGKPHGEAHYYRRDGSLQSVATYRDGVFEAVLKVGASAAGDDEIDVGEILRRAHEQISPILLWNRDIGNKDPLKQTFAQLHAAWVDVQRLLQSKELVLYMKGVMDAQSMGKKTALALQSALQDPAYGPAAAYYIASSEKTPFTEITPLLSHSKQVFRCAAAVGVSCRSRQFLPQGLDADKTVDVLIEAFNADEATCLAFAQLPNVSELSRMAALGLAAFGTPKAQTQVLSIIRRIGECGPGDGLLISLYALCFDRILESETVPPDTLAALRELSQMKHLEGDETFCEVGALTQPSGIPQSVQEMAEFVSALEATGDPVRAMVEHFKKANLETDED